MALRESTATMSEKPLSIKVECYAGYRGEQEPTRIWLGNELLEVKEIQDRWLSPEHRYFKILNHDNNTYIIRQSSKTQDWELYMYRTGRGA